MSYTFIFSQRSSVLTKRFYPPIILEEDATYVLGLIDFLSFNTITNIDKGNNKFFIGNHELTLEEGTYEIKDIEKTLHDLLSNLEGPIKKENYTDADLLEQITATIKNVENQTSKNENAMESPQPSKVSKSERTGPAKRKADAMEGPQPSKVSKTERTGSTKREADAMKGPQPSKVSKTEETDPAKRETDAVETLERVKRKIDGKPGVTKRIRTNRNERTALILRANRNTFRCEIKSNKEIDFERPGTIASLLGFKTEKLSPNIRHLSDVPINITKVNSICVNCSLVQNSFLNNTPVHILHMFYPNVAPGYKIIENPSNVIYLPINTRYIDEIELKITDQSGELLNFKGDLITIRLHLKKL